MEMKVANLFICLSNTDYVPERLPIMINET